MSNRFIGPTIAILGLSNIALTVVVLMQAQQIVALNENLDRVASIVSRLWEIWGK